MSVQGITRLQKEYRLCAKDFQKQITAHGKIVDNYVCAPDPDNIFEWYFLIFNLGDEPYKGGYYMGQLSFPDDFPWKPPGIKFITPTGRFAVNARICLSISDYHPESWNPIWHVEQIIIGAVSFFLTDTDTVGAIERSHEERKKIADESQAKILAHPKYKAVFESFKPYLGFKEEIPKIVESKPEDKAGQEEEKKQISDSVDKEEEKKEEETE